MSPPQNFRFGALRSLETTKQSTTPKKGKSAGTVTRGGPSVYVCVDPRKPNQGSHALPASTNLRPPCYPSPHRAYPALITESRNLGSASRAWVTVT